MCRCVVQRACSNLFDDRRQDANHVLTPVADKDGRHLVQVDPSVIDEVAAVLLKEGGDIGVAERARCAAVAEH